MALILNTKGPKQGSEHQRHPENSYYRGKEEISYFVVNEKMSL